MSDERAAVYGEIDEIPEYDPKTGEHLWTMMAVYRVEPATGHPYVLDRDSAIGLKGPGCFYCVEKWPPRPRFQRCKGYPTVFRGSDE